MGIVRRGAGAREVHFDLVMICPEVHYLAGKFGAIVGKQRLRSAAQVDQPVQDPGDILAPQA